MIMQELFKVEQKSKLPDPIWCAWFAGFVDGEGYFQIDLSKNSRGASIRLTIALREDDKQIIDEIHNVLLGDIYYLSYKRDRVKGKHSCNQWRWIIRNINQINKVIIPLLDQYTIRTKKKLSYEIWREAAMIVQEKNHLSISGRSRLLILRDNLKNIHKSPYREREKNYRIEDSIKIQQDLI